MDVFYKNSIAEKGTLGNIKQIFEHKSLKPSDVMNNFQHVWDFVEVCTYDTHVY